MIQMNQTTAIIIIAAVALIYTYTGGVKGVIWVDVIQMFIYLGRSNNCRNIFNKDSAEWIELCNQRGFLGK